MYNPIKPYKHEILKSIERTWRTPYVEVMRGAYPLIKKKFPYTKYAEVDHTDGIGTKGFYHWKGGYIPLCGARCSSDEPKRLGTRAGCAVQTV